MIMKRSMMMKSKSLFEGYTSKDMYEAEGIRWIEPMLAKEIEDGDKQNECLCNSDYFIEEKFDGTRATLHFFEKYTRCFSRRVSEKTGWFCENSDSVPHIRDLAFPELVGTIIDGEMFIPNRPFKDVASTLNCKWDKAIQRQEELGNIVFHAFDIMYYKGIRVEMLPLHRRKEYLQKVVDIINSKYIEMVKFYSCNSKIPVRINSVHRLRVIGEAYPTLLKEVNALDVSNNAFINPVEVSPRAYYEYIVATGGEGVIVKPKNGKYYYKRGWEYSKIKKFLTKDVIVLGFTPPTDDYKGKFPTVDKWDYWETVEKDIIDLSDSTTQEREQFKQNWYPCECRPISKFYAMRWVGNIQFGVIVTQEEVNSLPSSKKFNVTTRRIESKDCLVLEVGECSGFDESTRAYITEHKYELIGTTIEVKANELFKDTGKLRHPRFLRFRPDKSPLSCIWKDHLNEEVL